MTLTVEKRKNAMDESTLEFLQWIEELRAVRDQFDTLLQEYEAKKSSLVEATAR